MALNESGAILLTPFSAALYARRNRPTVKKKVARWAAFLAFMKPAHLSRNRAARLAFFNPFIQILGVFGRSPLGRTCR